MTDAELLILIKTNLAITSAVWDDYLYTLIDVARQSIKREGIALQDTAEDNNLIVMYVAYLYRKRAESTAGMPRMLRLALNNRVFAEKSR